MLLSKFSDFILECGADEAGRGCLAGPVTAAAVIDPDAGFAECLTQCMDISCCRHIPVAAIEE